MIQRWLRSIWKLDFCEAATCFESHVALNWKTEKPIKPARNLKNLYFCLGLEITKTCKRLLDKLQILRFLLWIGNHYNRNDLEAFGHLIFEKQQLALNLMLL